MNDDFEILDPLNGPAVRVRFLGRFEGAPVRWDAVITTLSHAGVERSFIEIGELGPEGRKLHVALPVPSVTKPTVRKAVVMVRNYKRLARGRLSFGPIASD